MLNYKKPRFWVVVASLIVLIGVSIALLTNSVASESEQRELIYHADVDGNGYNESIFIDKSQMDNKLVTLIICNSSGKELWSNQFSTSHAGWGSLFLCELDGKQYLLSYNPYIGQGYAAYNYALFTLEGGIEKVYRSNTLEFDIIGITELNPPKMIAFAGEVNELLEKSVLLLSTDGGEYYFGPTAADPFFERYSWLDLTPDLYDDYDDLETKLAKYNKYAVTDHNLYEEKYFPNQSDSSKNITEKSPNGEITADIVRKNGVKYDTVIFKDDKDNLVRTLDLENILYTGIESTAWIDDTRYTILGHINPYLQVYVIADAKKNEIVGQYYGLGFTWNQNKNKLYYIETSPHFAAQKTSDKIVDAEGNIYYVTEPGVSMTDKLFITSDEKTFAFFINDNNCESTKLYIATVNKENKLEKQYEIDAAVGDIEMNDDKSIKVITPDGATNYYNIPLR